MTVTTTLATPEGTPGATPDHDRDAYVLALLPVCGQRAVLPAHLVPEALAFAPDEAAASSEVERDLRCGLQAHTGGDHCAFVMCVPSGSIHESVAVWAFWDAEHEPRRLESRPDCIATVADEVCCAHDQHPGAHTFDLTDPWRTSTASRLLIPQPRPLR